MRSALFTATVLGLLTFQTHVGRCSEPWDTLQPQDGVELWQHSESSYTLATFRSRSIIHAPIAQLSAIIWDAKRGCDWMVDCVVSKLLEARGKNVTIQYNRTHTSDWLPDHDVVVETELTLQPQEKLVRLVFHNVSDSRSPDPRFVVRIAKLEGFFELHQLDAGTTEVIYQTTIDPGGSVPATMAKAPTLESVVKLHRSLRRQAIKQDYNADMEQMLKDYDWSGFTANASTHTAVDASR